MRVLMSVDMEGIGGVVDPEDVTPGTAEYERCRVYMTEEANAAARGVFAVDAEAEVLVSEAHGPFRNLVHERLDRRVELVRGKPKPEGMMSGISEDVDSVIFLGYHGKAGTAGSVLAHTVNGGVIADVRCDGRSLGELGLNTALAAHHGAQPVLVAGDDSVAREASEVAPGVRCVVVKRAVGNRAASLLHPSEVCERIEAEVPAALAARAGVRPLHFAGPVTVEVDVLHPAQTERALLVPGMERTGGRTLAYRAPSFPVAYGVVQLVSVLGGL